MSKPDCGEDSESNREEKEYTINVTHKSPYRRGAEAEKIEGA
jgi:hypothetical protein